MSQANTNQTSAGGTLNRRSPAFRKGRKAGAQFAREHALSGGRVTRPACPYNGAQLSDEWTAGFAEASK
jgi:hypothetical protein